MLTFIKHETEQQGKYNNQVFYVWVLFLSLQIVGKIFLQHKITSNIFSRSDSIFHLQSLVALGMHLVIPFHTAVLRRIQVSVVQQWLKLSGGLGLWDGIIIVPDVAMLAWI